MSEVTDFEVIVLGLRNVHKESDFGETKVLIIDEKSEDWNLNTQTSSSILEYAEKNNISEHAVDYDLIEKYHEEDGLIFEHCVLDSLLENRHYVYDLTNSAQNETNKKKRNDILETIKGNLFKNDIYHKCIFDLISHKLKKLGRLVD